MIRYTLPAFVGVLVLIAQRQPTGAAPVAEEIKVFSTSIQPMLKTYCIKCHNNDTQEGGVNYAAIRDDSIAITKRGLWKRAFKRIESGEMPPEGAKPLAPADKESLVRWMKFAAEYVDCDPSRRDPGPSIARRLTRTEYNLTVRDLFGFPFDSGSAVGMPEDGGGEHFDNLAADLSFEEYARSVVNAAHAAGMDVRFSTR